MKKINYKKIVKQIKKINKQLRKDNYYLSVKGMVNLVANLIEEQLK